MTERTAHSPRTSAHAPRGGDGVTARRPREGRLARIAITAMITAFASASCGVAEDAEELARPEPAAATGAAHVGPIAPPTLASLGPMPPSDGIADLPDARAIRDSLLAIVARRDSAALFAMVAPDIKLGFGGEEGIDEARRLWFAPDRVPSIWETLDDLLTHGGAGTTTEFTAPYWFTSRLPDGADPFEALVVIDSATVVRGAPDTAAAAIGTLGHVVVRAADAEAPAGWSALALDSLRTGYVRSDQVRSPVGYRIRLERRADRWWITFLLQGD